MLDPDLVLEAVVSAWRSVPALVAEMGGDSSNIYGHTFGYGVERSLALSVFEQTSPSILVAYLDLLGGQFSGMSVWKHRLEAYIRPKNQETNSSTVPATPPHLVWMMLNLPVLGGTQNIRNIQLLEVPNGGLLPMDIPTMKHQTDENGADLFVVSLSIPEWSDA